MKQESLPLDVWVNGRLDGRCFLPIESVAARGILKGFPYTQRAEFRDPKNCEIYRYDPATNAIYRFIA